MKLYVYALRMSEKKERPKMIVPNVFIQDVYHLLCSGNSCFSISLKCKNNYHNTCESNSYTYKRYTYRTCAARKRKIGFGYIEYINLFQRLCFAVYLDLDNILVFLITVGSLCLLEIICDLLIIYSSVCSLAAFFAHWDMTAFG